MQKQLKTNQEGKQKNAQAEPGAIKSFGIYQKPFHARSFQRSLACILGLPQELQRPLLLPGGLEKETEAMVERTKKLCGYSYD